MELTSRLLAWRRPVATRVPAPAVPVNRPAASPAYIADTWVGSSRTLAPTGGAALLSKDAIEQELGSIRQALTDLMSKLSSVVASATQPPAAPPAAPAPAAPATEEGGQGPVLKRGLTGEPVTKLQERLGQLGFDPGGVDGQFGPNTDAAVKAFQQSRGIDVDGIVGPQTWNKLGITVEGTATPQEGGKGPVLRRGLSGDPVKRLQERLAELGFDPCGADGAFGPNTDAAVKAFQQSRGLEADGVVGPQTWNKLGITVEGEVHGADSSAGPDGATVQTVDGPMVSRQGKLISPQIAGNFDRMVAAAAQQGVSLEINDGYRSSDEQAVLYQKYKSGQGPIAAPPGQSLHNKGLAIDFYDRPGAWAWLKAHAADYGLHNFDPEPWHYSTTGG